MTVTLELPDEVAGEPLPDARILAGFLQAGLRRHRVESVLVRELSAMVERLSESPGPEEIIAMRVGDAAQERMEELLERNREGALSDDERREWDEFERLECLVRMGKISAAARVKAQ